MWVRATTKVKKKKEIRHLIAIHEKEAPTTMVEAS